MQLNKQLNQTNLIAPKLAVRAPRKAMVVKAQKQNKFVQQISIHLVGLSTVALIGASSAIAQDENVLNQKNLPSLQNVPGESSSKKSQSEQAVQEEKDQSGSSARIQASVDEKISEKSQDRQQTKASSKKGPFGISVPTGMIQPQYFSEVATPELKLPKYSENPNKGNLSQRTETPTEEIPKKNDQIFDVPKDGEQPQQPETPSQSGRTASNPDNKEQAGGLSLPFGMIQPQYFAQVAQDSKGFAQESKIEGVDKQPNYEQDSKEGKSAVEISEKYDYTPDQTSKQRKAEDNKSGQDPNQYFAKGNSK